MSTASLPRRPSDPEIQVRHLGRFSETLDTVNKNTQTRNTDSTTSLILSAKTWRPDAAVHPEVRRIRGRLKKPFDTVNKNTQTRNTDSKTSLILSTKT